MSSGGPPLNFYESRDNLVARVDIARRLPEAIWHMLTTNKPFAPAGATLPTLAA